MRRRRFGTVVGLCLLATGCSTEQSGPPVDETAVTVPTSDQVASTRAPSTTGEATTAGEDGPRASPSPAATSTSVPTTTLTSTSTTGSTTTTAQPTTSTTTPTTTTTIPLPADVHDPACARVVQAGESLSVIADGIDDPTVTAASLQTENAVVDANVLEVGALLDICPGNGIDDLTGAERLATASADGSSGVAAQQRKLNELFAGTGLPALTVDGVLGPFTRQQLCAARMTLNLPISRNDMEPGSPEEQALMATASISVPAAAAVAAPRWIVIDKTCQVMFAGEGDGVTFVFKTSTGEPGWETRDQDAVRLYRYNPALHNAGWHNSSKFPVAEDNPLNGNMYKPIYFYRGQAIHGANNVPPEPASKGCARLRVENQDALVGWLALGDITQEIYDEDRINAVVTVQGEYIA